MDHSTRRLLIIAVVISLAIGFGGGFSYVKYEQQAAVQNTIQQLINKDKGKPESIDFGLFWQVWETVQSKYVDRSDVDMRKLLYGAISGMVNSIGDPYTVFFEPVTSKKFQEEISGSFGGVGMEIGKRDDVITVVAPLKGTPASRAGLKAGDKILRINAQSTEGLSVEEAVTKIRGPRGTKVTLTIVSAGDGQSRDVTLIRDIIKIPTIDWKLLDGKVAYLAISVFNQNVDSEFKKAAQEILASDAERLIVDLRNNPGGLLDSAVNLAGWFLEKDSVVTVEDFGRGRKNEFRANGNGLLQKYPTVLLINGGSASASEILAGALHDNRGVKLVGEKSFGKGSVQELISFFDDSSLKVTVAKWLTPSGISISEKGIQADIEVAPDPKRIESGDIVFGEPGKDPQLDRAIQVVRTLSP